MTARQAALGVLGQVLSKGAYLNLALKEVHGLSDQDQSFVTALVTTTLEHLHTIDYVLSQATNLDRTSARVRNILRLGACQILYMNSIPASAAVNESVTLVRKVAPGLRGFVNGVLRNVARREKEIQLPDAETDFIEYLRVVYSYPKWICEMFVDQLGRKDAEALLAYTGTRGQTGMRRTARADGKTYPGAVPGIYLDDAVYVPHAKNLAKDPLLQSGMYTVQSESSMLCVRALGLSEDAKILDLCAAPGGKSAYAAQIASSGHVTACDVHAHRCRLIEQTAERLGVGNITTVEWDATKRNDAWEGVFDAVLVDAPCSALGLMYRKPDIRYSRKKEDLTALRQTQEQILDCARHYVRDGGTLVYSTCTIDQIENQDVTRWFLDRNPEFQSDDLAKYLPGPFAERAVSGQIQLFPPHDDLDGFYISRMRKG